VIRILFGLIASLGVLMALGTVLARNLVHAALFLVAFFFLVACQFVLLEAEFLAAMQVLVYIGAVAIILMFGIMLTRNIQGDETTGSHWIRKLPAAAIAIGLLAVLVAGIVRETGLQNRPAWSANLDREAQANAPRAAVIGDMSRGVGNEMLGRFVIPFEVAGILLTAALVGAVALARSEETDEPARMGAVADLRTGTTAGPGMLSNGHSSPAASPPAGTRLSPSREAS
jgi:NADH-quinone oxidoreductase subunit J